MNINQKILLTLALFAPIFIIPASFSADKKIITSDDFKKTPSELRRFVSAKYKYHSHKKKKDVVVMTLLIKDNPQKVHLVVANTQTKSSYPTYKENSPLVIGKDSSLNGIKYNSYRTIWIELFRDSACDRYTLTWNESKRHYQAENTGRGKCKIPIY